jgi:hypothetical protein
VWPFNKKPEVRVSVSPQQISFSQVDITNAFGDNLSLGPDDWVDTAPLNVSVPDPRSQGLPAVGAAAEETYGVADRLSRLRESIPIPNDGVYCPICHKANVTLARLRTPCPTCGRPLLKFGWD